MRKVGKALLILVQLSFALILRHSEILMGPGALRLESKVRVHSRAGAGGQGEVWGVHIGSCDKAPLSRITAHTRTLTPPDKYVPLTNYTPFDS